MTRPVNPRLGMEVGVPHAAGAMEADAQAIREDIARRIAEEARCRAPFRTGRLRDGIYTLHLEPDVVVSDVFYSRFFEDGTSKMAPRPFLRPAIEQVIAEVEAGDASFDFGEDD